MNENQTLRIEETGGERRLIVPHLDGTLTFSDIVDGGDYRDVRHRMKLRGCRLPTMEEACSLIYSLIQNPDVYDKTIGKNFGGGEFSYLWTSTYMGCKEDPKTDGVVIGENSWEFEKRNLSFKKLKEMCELQDPDTGVWYDGDKNESDRYGKLRYVEPGYPVGYMDLDELIQNPLAVGLVGKDGVRKFVESVPGMHVAHSHEDASFFEIIWNAFNKYPTLTEWRKGIQASVCDFETRNIEKGEVYGEKGTLMYQPVTLICGCEQRIEGSNPTYHDGSAMGILEEKNGSK